jgi:hypothetical protein
MHMDMCKVKFSSVAARDFLCLRKHGHELLCDIPHSCITKRDNSNSDNNNNNPEDGRRTGR